MIAANLDEPKLSCIWVGETELPLNPTELRFFEPLDDVNVVERSLPHWMQSATVSFLTWRTCDSIPCAWSSDWLAKKRTWLIEHGIDPDRNWHDRLASLPAATRREYHRKFPARWESCLDESHGECVLRQPELRQVVADALRYFDGDRYVLTDFVVMPNHVHVLAAFESAEQMLQQCEGWKRFTAVRINRILGQCGRFWQHDGFDHLVRGPQHFARFRRYIAQNPVHARLQDGQYTLYSAEQFNLDALAAVTRGASDPPERTSIREHP